MVRPAKMSIETSIYGKFQGAEITKAGQKNAGGICKLVFPKVYRSFTLKKKKEKRN